MKIYKHPHVQQVQEFYGELLKDFCLHYSVQEHLRLLAEKLWSGIKSEHEVVAIELSNYHPNYLGEKWLEIKENKLSKADAFRCIAAQYGFGEWEKVEALGNQAYHQDFEQLVDLLLAGEISELKSLVKESPEIIQLRSSYGHQASILHYCASNGMELWRQQVPANLVAISEFLIGAGADKSAKMKVYGGAFTPLPLLETSAHPLAAGIMDEMKAVLS